MVSISPIPAGFSHPINQDSNEFPLKVAGYRLSSQLSGRRTSTAPVGARILSETMADLWLCSNDAGCGWCYQSCRSFISAAPLGGISTSVRSETANSPVSRGKTTWNQRLFLWISQIRQVTVDCLGVGGATDHGVPETGASEGLDL